VKLDNGKFSTQELVCSLLYKLEICTDLVCWIDVARGMGVGQDLFKEMLRGVTRANIAVVFLSDAYVTSPNCQRGFIQASRLCKYIISE
jgi:hypothetical protein